MVHHEDCVTTGDPIPGPEEPSHADSAAARYTEADCTVADSMRRATLARLAGLCGLALSGEAWAALAGPRPARAAPEILTRDELALTGVLAELIIPRTDTPGALGVGAHRTIDHLLAVCAPPPAQAEFKAALARLQAATVAHTGKRLAALPPVRQEALLRALDMGAAPFSSADQAFFRSLKQDTVFAYYTSEGGATRELAYVPVPGRYQGNVKVGKATRTWAL